MAKNTNGNTPAALDLTNDDIDLSDGISLDFTAIKGMEPIPTGTKVLATVIVAKAGKSASGFPKIDLTWSIDSGEYEGRQIYDMLSFHQNALGVTKQKLVGMGIDKNFQGKLSPDDLLNLQACITLGIQVSDQVNPNTGELYEPRNKVAKVAPVSTYTPSTTGFDF